MTKPRSSYRRLDGHDVSNLAAVQRRAGLAVDRHSGPIDDKASLENAFRQMNCVALLCMESASATLSPWLTEMTAARASAAAKTAATTSAATMERAGGAWSALFRMDQHAPGHFHVQSMAEPLAYNQCTPGRSALNVTEAVILGLISIATP